MRMNGLLKILDGVKFTFLKIRFGKPDLEMEIDKEKPHGFYKKPVVQAVRKEGGRDSR